MTRAERLSSIIQVLADQRTASTQYLCKLLQVSESTVRRDIEFLSSIKNDVRKVHGGVVLDGMEKDAEFMFELKVSLNAELKRRVALAVAELIRDSDRVALDSGTTVLRVASELSRRQDLRVVTVDLQVAAELAKHEGVESFIVGGQIRPGYYSVGEATAIKMLDQFSIKQAVIGADAVDIREGVTNFSAFEVGVKRKLIESAETPILAADYTKFGKKTFYKVAPLRSFAIIVTNRELDVESVHAIRDLGIQLILS